MKKPTVFDAIRWMLAQHQWIHCCYLMKLKSDRKFQRRRKIVSINQLIGFYDSNLGIHSTHSNLHLASFDDKKSILSVEKLSNLSSLIRSKFTLFIVFDTGTILVVLLLL